MSGIKVKNRYAIYHHWTGGHGAGQLNNCQVWQEVEDVRILYTDIFNFSDSAQNMLTGFVLRPYVYVYIYQSKLAPNLDAPSPS